MFVKSLLIISFWSWVIAIPENPLISIKQGLLRGDALTTDDGFLYYGFRGVPYAKPPIGNLRFQNPQPPTSWEGVREAKEEGNICKQYDLITGELGGDEDCLFLNVYTPKLPNVHGRSKLPVMVWIHGGGFQSDSGNSLNYGPDWLVEQDVVLVTINYRCGVMGFLSLDIPGAPGNVGLKDQVAALRWIQRNIAAFSGDPENVTIFGQSAGGASVSYLLLSDLTDGLFHKAVSMSGSPLNPWAHISNAKANAFELCKSLNYSVANEFEALQCLRNTSADRLYEIIGNTPVTTDGGCMLADDNMLFRKLVFLPTVEKDSIEENEVLIHESFIRKLKNGNFKNIPLMAGYTNKEGLHLIRDAIKDPILYGLTDVNFKRYIPQEICKDNNSTIEIVSEEIKKFYYGDRPVDESNLKDFVEIKSDTGFKRGINTMIKLIAEHSKESVYYYMFSFDEFSVIKHENHDLESKGATHGEDLGYIFKHKLVDLPRNITNVENMRKRMVKMYTDFAKTGNPIPTQSDLLPVIWKPVTKQNLNYLDINKNLKLLQNPGKKNMDFWTTLIEKYSTCEYLE